MMRQEWSNFFCLRSITIIYSPCSVWSVLLLLFDYLDTAKEAYLNILMLSVYSPFKMLRGRKPKLCGRCNEWLLTHSSLPPGTGIRKRKNPVLLGAVDNHLGHTRNSLGVWSLRNGSPPVPRGVPRSLRRAILQKQWKSVFTVPVGLRASQYFRDTATCSTTHNKISIQLIVMIDRGAENVPTHAQVLIHIHLWIVLPSSLLTKLSSKESAADVFLLWLMLMKVLLGWSSRCRQPWPSIHRLFDYRPTPPCEMLGWLSCSVGSGYALSVNCQVNSTRRSKQGK